jgi:arsenate reductase (glutaredoxin)
MPESRTPTDEANEVTIFHNPSCSKSRGALRILDESAVDYEVVEYLRAPPSRATLQALVAKLVDPVADLVRTSDQRFAELGLDTAACRTAGAVIEVLLAHPELMQRPVVMRGGRAVIARPESRVAEVLD